MVEALILINTEVGSELEIADALKSLEEIKEIYVLYGIYDIFARVEAESIEKLKEIVAGKIRKIPRVKSTITMLVVERNRKS